MHEEMVRMGTERTDTFAIKKNSTLLVQWCSSVSYHVNKTKSQQVSGRCVVGLE